MKLLVILLVCFMYIGNVWADETSKSGSTHEPKIQGSSVRSTAIRELQIDAEDHKHEYKTILKEDDVLEVMVGWKAKVKTPDQLESFMDYIEGSIHKDIRKWDERFNNGLEIRVTAVKEFGFEDE